MRTCTPDDLPAPPEVRIAVADFVRRLRRDAPDAGDVIVYGSTARGEYGAESDVDVLVHWNVDKHAALDFLAGLSVDILDEHRVLISPFPVDTPHWKRWQAEPTRFSRAVAAEGVVVA